MEATCLCPRDNLETLPRGLQLQEWALCNPGLELVRGACSPLCGPCAIQGWTSSGGPAAPHVGPCAALPCHCSHLPEQKSCGPRVWTLVLLSPKDPAVPGPGPRRGLPPHRHKGPDPSPHSPCGPCGSLDLSWPAYCMGLQPLQTCNSGTLPSRMWGGEGSPARHPTKSGEKAQERQREGRLVSEPCWGGWGCALPGSTHPSQVLPIPPRGLCLWKALRSWLFLLST